MHSVRWDPENALGLCRPCHVHFTNRPSEFTTWLMDWRGRDWLLALEQKANEPWNKRYDEVLAMLKSYGQKEAA